jgi:nucleoid DNA-binding protein
MINNYLRKLVEDNHRIIIPSVGAFLRKNNANIPFEASITFSPFLRFNDNLLENLVAEKENISQEAAVEQVREFIQDLQATIAAKRPLYIKNLGVFYQDERNSVQFIYAETEQEATRKFQEVTAIIEGREVPTPDDPEKVEETPATATEDAQVEVVVDSSENVAESEPQQLDTTETPAQQLDITENPTQQLDTTETSAQQLDTTENPAQQLEAASSSLQQWMETMEKRKKEAATSPEVAPQPETPEKEDEHNAETPAQVEASPTFTKEAQQEPAQTPPAPQQESEHFFHQQPYQEDEVRRRRQEAIARALAEKARKVQARLDEEKIHQDQDDAARTFGVNNAPFVHGSWEDDRKSPASVGLWIFLSVVALAFAAGTVILLNKSSEPIIIEDPQDFTTPDIPTIPEPTLQPDAYYIVIGVFNFEDNAQTASQRLYNAKKLKSEVVKLSDGKFAVSLSKYSSKNAALKNINRYKRLHSKVWVTY